MLITQPYRLRFGHLASPDTASSTILARMTDRRRVIYQSKNSRRQPTRFMRVHRKASAAGSGRPMPRRGSCAPLTGSCRRLQPTVTWRLSVTGAPERCSIATSPGCRLTAAMTSRRRTGETGSLSTGRAENSCMTVGSLSTRQRKPHEPARPDRLADDPRARRCRRRPRAHPLPRILRRQHPQPAHAPRLCTGGGGISGLVHRCRCAVDRRRAAGACGDVDRGRDPRARRAECQPAARRDPSSVRLAGHRPRRAGEPRRVGTGPASCRHLRTNAGARSRRGAGAAR
jgi:hypothetical protein